MDNQQHADKPRDVFSTPTCDANQRIYVMDGETVAFVPLMVAQRLEIALNEERQLRRDQVSSLLATERNLTDELAKANARLEKSCDDGRGDPEYPICSRAFAAEAELARIGRLSARSAGTRTAPKGHEGHGEPCYYCGTPCNGLAGDPGQWPIPLCHADDPGRVKWHHSRCVHERLIENQATHSASERTVIDVPRHAPKRLKLCAIALRASSAPESAAACEELADWFECVCQVYKSENYLEQREDVRDGSDRTPLPNEAMDLLMRLREARRETPRHSTPRPEAGPLTPFGEALELLAVCREDCDLHYGKGEGARHGDFDTVAERVDAFLKRHAPQPRDA